MTEEKLKIIQDEPSKYHFKTKDNNLINIEHKDEKIVLDLFKWRDEATLQINLDIVPTLNHTFSENKIEVENSESILRVYPIDTRSTTEFYGDSDDVVQCQNGGVRFELVLKEKPLTNTFIIPIKSKNLRFSYQPFLTEQDIEQGAKRPLNVEGSYAVYHATKKNNQYKTGKAFHIYRPIVEDALSNKVWCAIHIDKPINPTSLTIIVPQKFLDEAIYPITIDPDFGEQGEGSSEQAIADDSGDTRAGSAWAMPEGGPFVANYIRAYIKSSASDTVDCKVFINQQDSVELGSHGQIAIKENLACGAAVHWEEFTLSSEGLTGEVVYILGIIANPDDVSAKAFYKILYDNNGAVDSYLGGAAETYANPLNPWVDNADPTTRDYSIYCNYSEAGPTTLIKEALKVPYANIKNIMKVPKAAIKKFMGVE